MGFNAYQNKQVDEALARVKQPLRLCREQHGVVEDVTFRIRYNGLGELQVVTIEKGPPNMTPQFIQAATATVQNVVTFPRTGDAGLFLFTDLGPAAAPHAAAINAASDQRDAVADAARNKARTRNAIILAVVVGSLAAIGYFVNKHQKSSCVERGMAYFKEIGSYPYLTDGRDAEKTAIERCNRTSDAF